MKIRLVRNSLLVCLLFNSYALAQDSPVPIVDLRLGGLIGGSQNGAWVDPGIAAESILLGSMDLNIFGFRGPEKAKVRNAKQQGPIDDVCQDFVRIETGTRDRLGFAIGSNAKWKPMPRIPSASQRVVPLTNAQSPRS